MLTRPTLATAAVAALIVSAAGVGAASAKGPTTASESPAPTC